METALPFILDYAKDAALLTVGLLIYAQVRPGFARYPAWLARLMEGLCFSLLIALTMASPIALQSGVRIDLRATLVALAAIFGGPLCGLVAAVTATVLRVLVGGNNLAAGLLIVAVPFVGSLAYWRWITSHGRRVGYVDLLMIGVGIALCRVILWFLLFGYAFTVRAMDATWFGTLFLVAISAVLLGSAVLLVDERKFLAQTVADNEARFRSVLDQLPEGLTLVDRDDRFTYVNKAWEAVAGFAAAFALGKTRREIWQARGPAPGPFEGAELIAQVRDVGRPIRTEPRLIEYQGGLRWVVGTLFPVRNAKGEVREIGTTGNEVTDLVLARERLARREELAQRYKNALLDAVNATRRRDCSLLERIQALTEIAGDALEVERTGFFRGNFDANVMERVDLWERSTKRHAPLINQTMSALWHVEAELQHENVKAIEDVGAEPLLAERMEHFRQHDIRSIMLVPIFTEGRYFGTVTFSAVGRKRQWLSEETYFARSMADLLALLLAHDELARREETALRHKKGLLDAVHAGQTDEPLLEALHRLTELAGETLGVERTVVIREDSDTGGIERLDLWERSKRRHSPPERESGHAIWQLGAGLQREGVIALDDVFAEPRLAERADFLREHDMRSLMLAQIFLGENYSGIVGFASVGVNRHWTNEDMHFARSMADLIALRMVTGRYRESLAALDLIEDGIYVEGEDGRIIYANRAARKMAGLDHAGQPPLFNPFPAAFPRPPRPLEAEHDQHEIVLDFGTGPRDLRIDRQRLPRGGVIVLVHDITRRRAAERERERLEEELMQAHKLEALGEMAGGIAHDFNNLLGAIGGFARFLEEDLPHDGSQHEYAQRILSACDRGKALVTQILSFAKLRNVERHPIDLRQLLDGSLDLLRGLVSPMTAISFDIEDTPLPILGNDGQVTQLLVNLCANANDALGGEAGTVTVRARRIPRGAARIAKEERQLSLFDRKHRRRRMFGQLDHQRDYVRIDVSDSGSGIAPHLLPRIFEPFYTTKHRNGGTGLGLAVVQSMVSLYDGVLFVDSGAGKGTTFAIYLPLTEMATPLTAGAGVETQASGSERVLIVDDDVDVADMLSIGLERLGYDVAAVHDPIEALAAFREDPDNWDVAVLDRVMPEMDGITLAVRLRAVRSGLPVILCTGLDDGTIEYGEGRGAFDAFFTKPVAPVQIAGAIRRLVDR